MRPARSPSLPSSLSRQLREGTREAHSAAERMSFIQGFLRGVLEVPTYTRLLGCYYGLYQTLEEGLAKRVEHPWLAALPMAGLPRVPALAADLTYFLGEGWAEHWQPSPATRRYQEHLAQLADEAPGLLVAHAYVRYLGDVSGGQVLCRIAARSLGLVGLDGLRFYDFPELGDLTAFKQRFRAALDALPTTVDEQRHLVAEANRAFRYNMAIFAEFEGNAWVTLGRYLGWLKPAPAAKPAAEPAASPEPSVASLRS